MDASLQTDEVTMLNPLIGTVLMFLVIGALVILFATVWLRHFSRGPLEHVWDVSFRFITRRRSR